MIDYSMLVIVKFKIQSVGTEYLLRSESVTVTNHRHSSLNGSGETKLG